MDKYWASVFSGATAGIMAGIVLAVFFESIRRYKQGRERRDQIRYIAQTINKTRDLILNDKIRRSPDQSHESIENSKRALFRYMCETLAQMLDGRATRLSFDERYSLWTRIRLYTEFGNLNVPKLNTENFQEFFEDIDTIKWLEPAKHRTRQPVRVGRIRRWFRFGR